MSHLIAPYDRPYYPHPQGAPHGSHTRSTWSQPAVRSNYQTVYSQYKHQLFAPKSTCAHPIARPVPPAPPSPAASSRISDDLNGTDRLYPHSALPETWKTSQMEPEELIRSQRYPPRDRERRRRSRISRPQPPVPSASMGAWPLQTEAFRDPVAIEAARVSPGVDDTPYIQYAIDALTSLEADEDEDDTSPHSSKPSAPTLLLSHSDPAKFPNHQSTPEEALEERLPMSRDRGPYKAARPKEERGLMNEVDDTSSDASSMSTVVIRATKDAPATMIPGAWEGFDPKLTATGDVAMRSALDFRPGILRPLSILALMSMTTLMLIVLLVCAVYSAKHQGITAYQNTIYDGYYFLFRIFPAILASIILFYAQCLTTTMTRITPFAKLASYDENIRKGAIFDDLYPSSFLWPRLQDPWHIAVPGIITYLMNLTLPLQSSLFTVIFIDGHWRWATVQGVVWTLVVMYGLLLIALAIELRFWLHGKTGLRWDARSIADIVAMVTNSNTLASYRGTDRLTTRADSRLILACRGYDRLGYWADADHTKFDRQGFWYSLGIDVNQDPPIKESFDHKDGQRAALKTRVSQASAHDPLIRYHYLPWCLRTGPLLACSLASLALLITLIAVSFSHKTLITNGFLPGLSALPQAGAFSAADFLWSFLPSLLGMILFLTFQNYNMALRILQPWAELASYTNSSTGGARARNSILADYAACYPFQVTYRALTNKHWRLAWTSFLSTVFILIPILAGGMFISLTDSADDTVRVYPNNPAFGLVMALLVLYGLALLLLIPGRQYLRLPHGVTCLAEIISFCANGDIVADDAFKNAPDKTSLRANLGAFYKRPQDQPRWSIGVRNGALGINRVRQYTTLPQSAKRAPATGDGQATHMIGPQGNSVWTDGRGADGPQERQFVFQGRRDRRMEMRQT